MRQMRPTSCHYPHTSPPTWFGNLTSAYRRARHQGATRPPYRGDGGSYHPALIYGDGTVIATEDLELVRNIKYDTSRASGNRGKTQYMNSVGYQNTNMLVLNIAEEM
ncbi:hypothetical protein P171DRAFT_480305 [Karstenula rhodostoma CBS 690.94]|uniref:Uncharacterized protein n=1 Tax=Karstenula rhodostoma CBS 690.94 TaxID=1392251 RepID=A0A9P4UH41_9PLEO|nr:hypothetical protein P171DRAFT_480305 [Karstenula rhodostoma CBS 690.94]